MRFHAILNSTFLLHSILQQYLEKTRIERYNFPYTITCDIKFYNSSSV